MRTWADVYDSTGSRVAVVDAIISANATAKLDEAGTFDLQCAVDEPIVDYLITGNEIALWAQEDNETPIQWVRGRIIKPKYAESGDNTTISIAGRDLMEELRWRTVGLGRAYNAQTIQTIMSSLTSLVNGWTAYVETASAALLQTARFDGTKVLKAILKSADQMGLHVRTGSELRLLEVGAFGDRAATVLGVPIRAMHAPSSSARELYDNDAVLLIDSISVTEDGDTLVNWAIPMGAGEGSAATTLKDTSFKILNSDNTTYRAGTTPYYPIYRRVNDFGIVEYYIDASLGDTQHQDTLSFKEIGPIANSATAKALASDALATACIESLKRTRTALTSYTVSVRKVRADIRPGDRIRLTYKGMISTLNSPRATRRELVYIDVDEDMWVMAVQRGISDSGIVTTLTINTVDRHIQDDMDIVVEVLDRSEVTNLSVQTFPFWSENTYTQFITYGARFATFKFQVDANVTDLMAIYIRFKSEPLFTLTHISPAGLGAGVPIDNYFQLIQGDQHPKGVHLYVDGVDVSSSYSGPWNPVNTDNTALDVSCDITSLILAGDIYSEHIIELRAEVLGTGGTYDVPGYSSPSVNAGQKSSGLIEMNIRCRGIARAF